MLIVNNLQSKFLETTEVSFLGTIEWKLKKSENFWRGKNNVELNKATFWSTLRMITGRFSK